jgi:CubicO group peptidase (beta-lactamase class C family)
MRLIAALSISLMLAALALGVAPSPGLASAAAPDGCGTPAAMGDAWPVAAAEKEGLDAKLICTIGSTLEKMRDADPNGVVVIRHGVLVYEHYFVAGIEYAPNTLHDVRSITKSIVAILAGIALDRGWLKSLDTPVFSFFPNYADLRTPGKDRITLADLLSMTSGLAWPELATSYNDPSNILRQMIGAAHPYRFVLARPLVATPGTVWNYNSGGVELLGDILQKVSHRPLDKFAKQALFDPLEITDWQWQQGKNGTLAASWGLWLRPRDLAKIGQLVLDHGVWEGHKIVSAAWIKTMTARHSPPGWLFEHRGLSYGYLWWRGKLPVADHSANWAGGIGWGGQRLFVVPSLDLVVAATAGVYHRSSDQNLAGHTALDLAARAVVH